MTESLKVESLTLSYGVEPIIENLNLTIPMNKISVLIGANGCGKSTLLRSIARLLKPKKGAVLLDGKNIFEQSTKDIAKKMSILPQSPIAPEGLTVLQLVKQGRYPHQNWRKQWSQHDEEIVLNAITATGMSTLQHKNVDELSGGQRQRAWIAMTLAQDTDIILLDEPTTYLDLTHQIEILDLLFELNETQNRTIIMVLHDINLACRYADHIITVKNRTIFQEGKPEDIMTEALVKTVFDMNCKMIADPLFGTPMCLPYGKGRIIK
ncbi:ABC transporter ATP-binding protein [Kurthia sibirica]|uniref:Cobalamin/Fe(3+)-siderophore ABC transporter ATP-binding protein n=1 Tax=Kurthia sibirica TaxID=202750 RepID=A0A2U3AIL6_9BACL|nr:ABC transporter ATP-binding protein [Kurthia sibirica]PWI24301.1 cobalamin/Fe(3+)-siderophore ABC transporter ATP-binding protein [Kurthia sibirica]GEK35419.1 iron-enterobactin transporter ATP-binding protein [Kurthia sibirica]